MRSDVAIWRPKAADVRIHPITELFPDMSDGEFDALIADIREHGVRHHILLHEGQIVDGVNRFKACKKLGVPCPSKEWDGEGSLLDLVISLNVRRRHLTPSQLAMIGAEALPHFEAEARERSRQSGERFGKGTENIPCPIEGRGEARDHTARVVGVNPHYVSDAKAIKEKDPCLAEEVKAGKKTLSEVKRELRNREHRARPPVPGQFRVIYADPPWKYGKAGPGLDGYGPAERHYETMLLDEICDLRFDDGRTVRDIAEKDAVLFFWVTSPMLENSFKVIRAWGFNYKTSFVWDKVKHNFGHYNSVRHEFLLVATRGSCTPEVNTLFDSVVTRERSREHSEKPEAFRTMIDTLYPSGSRIELFARRKASGWEAWGSEDPMPDIPTECEEVAIPTEGEEMPF